MTDLLLPRRARGCPSPNAEAAYREQHQAPPTFDQWQNAPIPIAARFGRPGAAAMMDAIQKAAKALAQLSDREWLELKFTEDRRRAEQHTIRDLSKHYRELRDREPAR